LVNDENEEESNNSFIYTLSERLAEQFSYKHIHYGDFNKILLNFEELKTSIIQSMSTCTGYIIDHFPTSLDDLQKFQTEVNISFEFSLKKNSLFVKDWSLFSINLYK
jgi:hypothetical protein